MTRVPILLILATSLSALTIWATASYPTVGRTADRHPLFVEAASPRVPLLAMTIL